jgi:hypothetical protein
MKVSGWWHWGKPRGKWEACFEDQCGGPWSNHDLSKPFSLLGAVSTGMVLISSPCLFPLHLAAICRVALPARSQE